MSQTKTLECPTPGTYLLGFELEPIAVRVPSVVWLIVFGSFAAGSMLAGLSAAEARLR